MKTGIIRTRWAAIGAAVAVTLGAGGIGMSYATSPSGAAAFVPITPCRVLDTRPAPDNVGNRATPIGAGESHAVSAHGDNGGCLGIPVGATGLALNVTTLGATAPTFVTVWPTGSARPTASNLNPQPGQPPTPNAVTTGLSVDGQFNLFNKAGTVHVIVDIVGYYTDHDHDDRYYTKAEVDAGADGSVRSDDGKSAYAWSCSEVEPVAFPYDVTANCGYSFNPSGLPVTVTRTSTGRYSVSFPDLGMTDGHVQVTASGLSANTCKVAGWGHSSVAVRCFNPDGAAVDNTFTVLALD